jgi:hypothetical protein
MLIIYTGYAEETLKVREISKGEVEFALLNPEEIVEGKEARKIAHKMSGNKFLLRVVFETHVKTYIVITAYYSKPERYMKNENNL